MLLVKKTFRHGGYIPGNKEGTSHGAIRDLPIPDVVYMALEQYGGERCEPCVRVGDEVRPGQVISRGLLFPAVSHASLAGQVLAVTQDTIHVLAGGDQTFHPSVCRVPEAMTPEELLEVVVQAGIQENDSQGNHLYRRLTAARDGRVSTLIVNGMESEPYLTGQSRSLRERSALLIFGAKAALRLIGAERALLALPGNDAELLSMYKGLLSDEPALKVAALKPRYPQGHHNQLVCALTGREMPAGSLASDVGCLVLEVATLIALGEALVSGKPMIDRVISVSGPGVQQPGNYRVPIGTPFSHVLQHCGLSSAEEHQVIWGGPMTGFLLSDTSLPVTKDCEGLVVLPLQLAAHKARPFGDCVNCARCIEQCPQMLYPNELSLAAESGDTDAMVGLHVWGCSECGLCSYVCPANRPITQMNRACKELLGGEKGGADR
jgi:electron transport complex protein RnfC